MLRTEFESCGISRWEVDTGLGHRKEIEAASLETME